MRIHTVVSDSHRPLLDIYEASLHRVEPDSNLVIHEIDRFVAANNLGMNFSTTREGSGWARSWLIIKP